MSASVVSKRPSKNEPDRSAAAKLDPPEASASQSAVQRLFQSIWGCALLGSLLMYLALPPLDLWPLAWIAPVPWLMLARKKALPGRRPYRALWVAGFVFWFLALHWLRLPFWATAFGWLALSMYLAVYIPLLVGLTRVAVHRLGISIIVAAPVVWMGLELAKGHVLDGFTMGSLGHTQFRWIQLIQVSDLAGAYGVAFVVMFVAACVARMLPCEGRRWTVWPIVPAALMFAAVLGYGHYRMQGEITRPGPRVALIQGSIDTQVKTDPTKLERIWDEYFQLSMQAVTQHQGIDLVVWPETMFRYPLATFSDDFVLPPEAERSKEEYADNAPKIIRRLVADLQAPVLLGVDRQEYSGDREYPRAYNSSVFADRQGKLLGTYDKQILVMFGEYVPFADRFPALYKLTPLHGGVIPGKKPLSVELAGVRYSPNICFETVLPHLIAGHVRQLRAEGQEPDVLVNLTNDGWFWGSSELDMHLACGVFRAVECRKPLVIAANTGFSASIDGDGRILAQGPRRATGLIVADVKLDNRDSRYVRYGDLPAGFCLAACGLLGLIGSVGHWQRRRSSRAAM